MINIYNYNSRSETLYISSMGDYVAGIGIGEMGSVRSHWEMIERYALRRGPSKRIKFYDTGISAHEYINEYIEKYGPKFLDSSGSAVHRSIKFAVDSAFMEFCERQSLIAAWRYGCKYKIVEYGVLDCGAVYESREISLFAGIHVILTLLTSPVGEVMYAVGASASNYMAVALEKSKNELYQSIILMNDNIQRKYLELPLMDQIQDVYLAANNKTTIDGWKYIKDSIGIFGKKTFEDSISYISNLSYPPSVLIEELFYEGEPVYLARVLSDKWFLGLRDTRDPRVFSGSKNIAINITPAPFG